MNRFKFITLAFALLIGFSFASCSDDDDAPAYEQVVINDAASAGLKGNVKSVETTYYYSEYNDETDVLTKKDPSSKYVVTYDKKGATIGYESYRTYTTSGNAIAFRLSSKREREYDNRYRVILDIDEDYSYDSNTANPSRKYGDKTETVYNDSKGEATVSYYTWEDNKYVLRYKEVYALNPNGTLDEDVYEGFSYEQRATASQTEAPEYKSSRIVLEEDGKKNWTKAYYKWVEYDEDGKEENVIVGNYAERTIVYY